MPNKLTIPFSIIGLIGFVWICAEAFGGKADKAETDAIRARITEVETAHKLANQKQDQMLEMVKDIRDTQKWMVQELWRVSGPANNMQPPSSTPVPNPLNR